MTLLVTIFLVLINIFNNVTSNSPNVEGLTAISSKIKESVSSSLQSHLTLLSAWIITCILFVFGALAGYAGLLLRKNRLTRSDHINGR